MLKKGLTYGLFQTIAVLYLIIWTISPPLQVDLIYRLIALACAVVWVVIWVIRENPITFGKEQIAAVFFLIAVLLVVFFEKYDFESIIKQIALIMLVICFMMTYFYDDKWDELAGIVPIVLILLTVWNYKTFNILVEDHTIARLLVRDDETTYEYLRQGIGGYSLIYPQACISPLILAWIYKSFKHNKLFFVIGVAWIYTYLRLIELAGYSIALFASAIGLILLLFYRGKNIIVAFIITILAFAGIMAAIMYIAPFREWILETFDGTAVANKVNDLVYGSETGVTGDSIQVRINAYSASIMDMIRYPLIGSLWRESGGGHSALLDITSKYGILGGYAFSMMFYHVPLHYKHRYSDKFIMRTANATLVTLLFVSLLDSYNYSFTCMVMIVSSLIFEDIIKWTGAEKT
ncbi:MAG: hypothetical protein UHK54_00020 [Acutalibacteraceae bacterium]|nr:hypothetical protein [Acutalibacteraceae bacterium]